MVFCCSICRWIKEGRLSYFNADKALPKDIKFVRKDHNMFSHLVSVKQ